MLQCCVRLSSSVTLCIVAKRCVQSKSYYWEPIGSRIREIDWYQNEWPRIKVTSTIALYLTLSISETVRDRGLIPKDHQQEMAYGLSNGHVTDDVTWPWKVKLVTPIPLERNISKTAGFRDCSKGPPIGNGIIHYTIHVDNQVVMWPMTARDPRRCC